MIKVGVVGPFSGPRAAYGELLKSAVSSAWPAQKEVFEVIYADDQACPQQAVRCAESFIRQGVGAVLGHFNSACALAVKPMYASHGIPFLMPASTHPGLTEGDNPLSYRFCPNDCQQAEAIVVLLAELEAGRATVVVDDTLYGQSIAKQLVESAGNRLRLDVVMLADFEADSFGANSFDVNRSDETGTQPPVVFSGTHFNASALVNRIRAKGSSRVVICTDDAHIEEFIELLQSAPRQTYVLGLERGYHTAVWQAARFLAKALEQCTTAKSQDVARLLAINSAFSFSASGQYLDASWAVFRVTEAGFVSLEGEADGC